MRSSRKLLHSFTSSGNADGGGSRLSMNELKRTLLNATLKQVPQYGWTNDAIVAGSIQIGSEVRKAGTTQSHIPDSCSLSIASLITVQDLINHTMNEGNERLRQDLIRYKYNTHGLMNVSSTDNTTTSPPDAVHTTLNEYIIYAIQTRLRYIQPLIQVGRWHEGMAVGIQPNQIVTTQQQIKEMIQIICSQVPPTVTTTTTTTTTLSELEQVGLGVIYVATELHMLSDTSIEYTDTWNFLTDRVNEWDTIRNQVISKTLSPTSIVSTDSLLTIQTVVSAFATGAASVVYPTLSYYMMKDSSSSLSSVVGENMTKTTTTTTYNPPVVETETVTSNNHMDGTDPSHYEPKTTQSEPLKNVSY